MNAVVYLFLSVVFGMGIISALAYQYNQRLFLVPSVIVVLIGVVVSVNGYLVSDGWDSLDYLFVFISILLGVSVGALSPILIKKHDG